MGEHEMEVQALRAELEEFREASSQDLDELRERIVDIESELLDELRERIVDLEGELASARHEIDTLTILVEEAADA